MPAVGVTVSMATSLRFGCVVSPAAVAVPRRAGCRVRRSACPRGCWARSRRNTSGPSRRTGPRRRGRRTVQRGVDALAPFGRLLGELTSVIGRTVRPAPMSDLVIAPFSSDGVPFLWSPERMQRELALHVLMPHGAVASKAGRSWPSGAVVGAVLCLVQRWRRGRHPYIRREEDSGGWTSRAPASNTPARFPAALRGSGGEPSQARLRRRRLTIWLLLTR
jgi:hypothetical protein